MAVSNNESAAEMSVDDRLKAAWSQLTLVLSFFPRIDTKLSVILGLDLGMLAMLSTRLPTYAELQWWHLPLLALCGLPLALSLYHLYRGAVPDTRGGSDSLIYFGSVAAIEQESQFIGTTRGRTNQALADDIYGQVWRNSKILSDKFQGLQSAYRYLLLSIVPWLVTLSVLSALSAKTAGHG